MGANMPHKVEPYQEKEHPIETVKGATISNLAKEGVRR